MPINKGFTLIELSIVIVIIGLIVAGIVAGQNLINSARLNKVVSDVNLYKTSLNTFRLKYNDMPGDMADAESIYGAANTNNGNGNKRINGTTSDEEFLFWQHLALEGLINGAYTGTGDVGTDIATRNINVPAAFKDNSCFSVRGRQIGGADLKPDTAPRVMFILGAERTDMDCSNSAFTPTEQQSLDNKLDDGSPTLGKILAVEGADASPANIACDDGGNYTLTSTGKQCILLVNDIW